MIEPLEQRRLLAAGPRVVGFALVDADTDRPVRGYARLGAGAVVDAAAAGVDRFSLRARVKGGVRRVAFEVDGAAAGADVARPFHASGGSGRDVLPLPLGPGTHTLSATPFGIRRGAEIGGRGATIMLTIPLAAGPAPAPGLPVPENPAPGEPLPPSPPPADPSPDEPETSVRALVVDPQEGPFHTIGDAVQEAEPGDTVLIRPGIYHEILTLERSGRRGAPVMLAAQTPGTVTVDAGGTDYALGGSATHAAVSGITFRGADNDLATGAVRVGTGWSLTDVTVRDNDGAGVIIYGEGARLLRVTAERNGQQGIAGSGAEDVLVKDSVVRFNNAGSDDPVWKDSEHAVRKGGRWYVDPLWEAGAGKWMNCRGVTLDGLLVHDNGGPGIWLDYNNSDVVIRNCTVRDARPVEHDYDAPGVNIELTAGGVLVEENTLRDNPGGNVVIESSRDVTVRNNTIGGTYVALNDWPRGEGYVVRDVQFTGNRFEGSFVQTGGPGWTSRSGGEKRVVFEGNTYADAGDLLFAWGDAYYATLRAVRESLGFERQGAAI